ncbi:TRAP transporter substrate-binding protein [Azospirillum sp. RWY-5-1]|uniref:TRAP transporter substrate-binding protein n=1 Tax=Azospirillum oleiclasticum TaxID=2735135 RepID=A0ABX2TEJ6_9PROT|nr:TRAP transporter substrate-binding protein [Azospirillum oleiclasticum]NYZ15583.1 TRAP transporter substrate-binding protein [Azospirillum oleiclasticum]NYZ22606.1 TRAP transporter substrate-binding protein [Azospirillum oleiclasticum]
MRTAMLAFALGAALMAAPVAQAADVTLKLGHVTQTSHPFHIGAEMFRDAVAKKSGGKMEISVYPARQLGDDRQLLEGVRLGTIDAAVVSSSTFALFTPVMDALQLPFLIPSYQALSDAFLSPPADKMLASLDALGIKGLGYYEGGFRHFLNSKRPVHKVADMQGLKIRVVPNPLHIAIFRALGANPTPMPYGEVYTALETGALDGSEINVSSVLSERFYEKAKHMTMTGQYFFPAVTIVNKAKFDRLTPEQRKVLTDAARETIRPQVEAAAAQEGDAAKKISAQGVEIIKFDDVATAREKVKALSAEYEAKNPLIKEFAEHVRKNAQ